MHPKISILVIDNAPGSSGIQEAFESGEFNGIFSVDYIAVSDPGIVNARNRALEAVSNIESHLAFIDDDEWAHDSWVSSALEAIELDPHSVWAGPVYPSIPENLIAEVDISLMARPEWDDLQLITPKIGDGNVLLPPSIADSDSRYDLRFNFGGGQDTLFFDNLSKQGMAFRWKQGLAVTEDLPIERCTRRYFFERSRSNAYAYVKFERIQGTSWLFRLIRPARHILKLFISYLPNRSKKNSSTYYAGLRAKHRGIAAGTFLAVLGIPLQAKRRL